MTRKLLAVAALAFAAIFAAPTVANATGYTGQGVSVTAQPGEAVALTFTGLPANTPSTASADDAVTLSVLKASAASRPTDASGSVTYTASATQPGTYTITVTAGSAVATATLTVAPTDSASGGSGGLPSTGYEIPMLAVWGGVGAIVLGAALIVVLVTVRRNRASD